MESSSDAADLCRKVYDKHPKFGSDDSVGSIDPGYKLPLYLSEFALTDFNIEHDECYEKVNVVETLRINSVKDTAVYLVTFEASLPADETIQTFITKISMSLPDQHDPTTKIKYLFIKIKGEEFDYEEKDHLSDSDSWELYYDEFDSGCDDDQHSKQNLPDCNKKDFQKHLDGFDYGDQSKEMSPNFRNIVSEENLKESHEEDKSSEFQKKDSQKPLQGIDDTHSKQNFPEFHNKDSKENLSEFITPLRVPKKKYKVDLKLREEIESLKDDLARSDGFEFGYYPHLERAKFFGTGMLLFYDIENKTVGSSSMNHLVCLSQLAICVYNIKEDAYFDNVKVLKAITSGAPRVKYNITFEASLPDTNAKTFQTRLFTALPLPFPKIEIEFVRMKPNF